LGLILVLQISKLQAVIIKMIIHTRIDGNMSIPNLIYDIDAQCTNDLRNGLINGERDFVSNLLGQIRKPFGLLSSFSLGIAYTLPNKIEQKYGCDAIMIFRLDNKDAKIALFESKLPRYLTAPNAEWDSIYTKMGSKFYNISRFTSQLERQKVLKNSGVFLFELFINEDPKHLNKIPNYDAQGSNCVSFDHAWQEYKINKISPNIKWNNSDLDSLLSEKLNIFNIVDEMLKCNKGSRFSINNYEITIEDEGTNQLLVPIPRENQYSENKLKITDFMIENGLQNYMYIDIRKARNYGF